VTCGNQPNTRTTLRYSTRTNTRAILPRYRGVGLCAAQVIIAETGADMTRFPTAGHLASWAGMCPGNHESAGKHHGGTTRQGDSWLRGALGEAAAGAARSKDTYLQARYRLLAGHRGKKRALVAVVHSILIAIWHMIINDVPYADLGPSYFIHRSDPTRQARRLVSLLGNLGLQVTLTPSNEVHFRLRS
jgi:hypothetical protein